MIVQHSLLYWERKIKRLKTQVISGHLIWEIRETIHFSGHFLKSVS